MSRKKKPRMEYRYYEVPEKCPVLVLQGEKWLQNYGYQIDYLHFHNHLEVGFCYYGEGTVTFKEEDLPFDGNMFTVEELSAYYNLYGRQCQLLGVAVY